MADTTYTDNITVITADTMNDLNRLHYTIFGDPTNGAAALHTLITGLTADASPALSDYIGTEDVSASTGKKVLVSDLAAAITNSIVPAGVMVPYGGSAAPTGWLLCDGSSQLRATYANLFTAIGTTYGSADGTHFNLPDLRGRVVFGKDDMGGSAANRLTGSATGGITGNALGNTGGEQAHTLTGAESGTSVHSHSASGSGSFSMSDGSSVGANNAIHAPGAVDASEGVSVSVTVNNSSAANASSAHNTVPPGIVLNYIIKT